MAMQAPQGAPDAPARPRLRVITEAGYAMTPKDVLRDATVTLAARAIYGLMALRWWKSGECYVSLEILCEEAGCSLTQLRRYIKELVDHGYISAERWKDGQRKVYRPTDGAPTHALADEQLSTGGQLLPKSINRPPVDSQPPTRKGKRPPVDTQLSTGDNGNCPPVTTLKRDSGDPETTVPGRPDPDAGAGAVAAAPPAAAAKAQIAVANANQRAKRRDYSRPSDDPADGTLAPEALELTESTYVKWESEGFTRREIDLQVESMLAKYGLQGRRYPDWHGAFRQWMAHEALNGPKRTSAQPGRPNGAMYNDKGRRVWTGGMGAPHSVATVIHAQDDEWTLQ